MFLLYKSNTGRIIAYFQARRHEICTERIYGGDIRLWHIDSLTNKMAPPHFTSILCTMKTGTAMEPLIRKSVWSRSRTWFGVQRTGDELRKIVSRTTRRGVRVGVSLFSTVICKMCILLHLFLFGS